MLAKYCLDEERPHGLKPFVTSMFPSYANYDQDIKNHGEDEDAQLVWEKIPFDKLCKYCGIDSDLTLRGMIQMENKLIDLGFYNLFRNLLMMASRVLAESEYRGMIVDRPYLEQLMVDYKTKITDADRKLRSIPSVLKFDKKRKVKALKDLMNEVQLEIEKIREEGAPNANRLIASREAKLKGFLEGKFNNKEAKKLEPINFGSPKQLCDFMYNTKFGLRFKPPFLTESGNPSTAEDALEELKPKDKSGFIDALLTYRGLEKIDSTYVRGMHPLLDSMDRVHANFKIHGTVTGRLSCTAPNLQNIPRGTTAADIKKMFVPPPGYLLLEVDYSQAELRVVAELANDKAMIDIFKSGRNIHVATACLANKCPERYEEIKQLIKVGESIDSHELKTDPKWKEHYKWVKEKKRAKTLNFGILYGQTEKKLSLELDCTEAEATQFIKNWFNAFPDVALWIKRQKKYAHKHGYVYNMFGRKRRLYNIYSEKYGVMLEAERQAVNTPIQGTASDFTLFSQVIIREEILRGNFPRDLHQVYTVHDSIGYFIRPKDIHWVVPRIVDICANPQTKEYFGFELKKVTMKVSPEIGKNWADLTEYDEKENYMTWLKTA
jgi:DNA polymerase I-like protein with 3'-5' exonuclease and polymerase domains